GHGRVAAVAVELVTLPFPGRGDEFLGVGRVHLQVDDARLVVDVEHPLPALAAVGRLEDTALLVGAVQPADGADVDGVRVGRVDGDVAGLEGLRDAHVLRGLAAVGGLVDAVAVGDGVARVVLARPHPDDVAVGRGDGHGADGDGGLVVELVLEGGAVVGG